MKRVVKIKCGGTDATPEDILRDCGYWFYVKRGGDFSYIKKDRNGRFEAHIKGKTIELHYDVWVGKHRHMVLPSTHTTQQEADRIRKIIPNVNAVPKYTKPEVLKTPSIATYIKEKPLNKSELKRRENTLPFEVIREIDWEEVKKAKENWEPMKVEPVIPESYPQSTTCTLTENMLRWIKTKVTPWL